MKKVVAVSTVVAGIASFALGCADHPPALPSEAASSRPSFGASTPFNNAGACLANDALTWSEFVLGMHQLTDLNCTAIDVDAPYIVATEISLDGVTWFPLGSNPISCVQGSVLFLKLQTTFQANATSDRYDIGFWLATDGGDAKTGSCNHYNLPVGIPGVTNLDPVPDSCGNMSAGSSAEIDLGVVTTVCQAGPSGSLEISACVAWSTPADERECPVASVSGPNGFRAGTLPGTVSQCNCQPVVISTGSPPPQTGSITIVKTVVPTDPQDFSFTTTGSGLSNFILDDDSDGTLPNTHTFSSLAPGVYTVTEAATPGFDLTALTCTAGGSASIATRAATITLAQGANVTCTFTNAKRATVLVNKRENGGLPLSRAWEFEIRTGASTSTSGTVVATGSAILATGVVNFACAPNPNAACENVSGIATLVPASYQLCEINMPAGYSNNIPGFTPSGSVAEGGINATECIGFSLSAGGSGVPAGVPDPINNLPPAVSGGSIALQTGSFTLVNGALNDALSGNFSIRNSSGGTQQVFVTSLAIVNATFRDGPNLVQATVTGCVYTPLPVTIPASGSQSIALSGCQVTPSVRKELMFTVRATINNGDQPFYERTYKVRTQ